MKSNSWTRRLAFVHFTIEGLQVSRGGVGRWTTNLLSMLPELCAEWATCGVQIHPFIAEPRLCPTTPGYNATRLSYNAKSLAALGGGVRLLCNDGGMEVRSKMTDLPALAVAGTQVVLGLLDRYDTVFTLSGESAFARLPALLDRQVGDHDVRLVHTHGATIPEGPYEPDPAELAGDATLAAWTRRSERVRIAYISEFMRGVFADQYAVPRDRLVPNLSGIMLDDPAFAPGDPARQARKLAARGVPADRPLVISWGRNSRPGLDKGFDLLLRAAALLDGAVVPVVVTRDEDPGLRRLAAELVPAAVLLHDEPFETIAALLQAPNALAACFLSAAEHGAVTPMEAAWTAGPACVLVAAGTGSFRELVFDGETGMVAGRAPESVVRALRRALELSEAERRALRTAAAERVRLRHDQRKNVAALFDTVLADLVPDRR